MHFTFLLLLGYQLSNYHIVPILNTREVKNSTAIDLTQNYIVSGVKTTHPGCTSCIKTRWILQRYIGSIS